MRLGIARTIPRIRDDEPVHEVEAAWLEMIAGARRMIYAESQYFASRRVAKAIALRLAEDDPPEIVIVNPVKAEGWLEPLAMDTARARRWRRCGASTGTGGSGSTIPSQRRAPASTYMPR